MNIILRKGRYALIDRGHEYVVAMGFDETQPENQQWEQGMYYTHWNESEIKKMCCLQVALDHFRLLVDMEYISRRRLEELTTKFKDGLLECDEDFAMEFFEEECELLDSEMEWLGITESEEDDDGL